MSILKNTQKISCEITFFQGFLLVHFQPLITKKVVKIIEYFIYRVENFLYKKSQYFE